MGPSPLLRLTYKRLAKDNAVERRKHFASQGHLRNPPKIFDCRADVGLLHFALFHLLRIPNSAEQRQRPMPPGCENSIAALALPWRTSNGTVLREAVPETDRGNWTRDPRVAAQTTGASRVVDP